MADGRKFLSAGDYTALGLSLLLALGMWLGRNLSQDYTGLVQRRMIAMCEIDGHDNVSAESVELAASCDMSGLSLLGMRMSADRHNAVTVKIAPEDMHHKEGDTYYMTSADLNKYFHLIYMDNAKLEYFVSDTVFFTFNTVLSRKLPVKFMSNLGYKPQYMALGEVKYTPDSVIVYGEKSLLDAAQYVTTDLVRHHNLDAETFGTVKVKEIPGLRMSAKSVSYVIPVVRYVQREVTLPVYTINVPRGTAMKVFPSSVNFRYRMRFPADTDISSVYVCVDYDEFNSSRKGKCVAKVFGLPDDILQYSLDKEVFDCFVEVSDR